jgi:hypothetical protein
LLTIKKLEIMAYLWKVTAKRSNGRVTKGMEIEILKNGTTAKPSQKEIANALNSKYNTEINDSQCGQSNFDFEKTS